MFSQYCNVCEHDCSQAENTRMRSGEKVDDREGDFGQLLVGKVGPPVLSLGPRRESRGGQGCG